MVGSWALCWRRIVDCRRAARQAVRAHGATIAVPAFLLAYSPASGPVRATKPVTLKLLFSFLGLPQVVTQATRPGTSEVQFVVRMGEPHHTFLSRKSLDFADATAMEYERPADSMKSPGRQFGHPVSQQAAHQVRFPGGSLDQRIILAGLNPENLLQVEQKRTLMGIDDDTCRFGGRRDHGLERRLGQAGNRTGQTLGRDWFQQVVAGPQVERLQGVLLVGRDEHRSQQWIGSCKKIEPAATGHLDIQEQQIRRRLGDQAFGLGGRNRSSRFLGSGTRKVSEGGVRFAEVGTGNLFLSGFALGRSVMSPHVADPGDKIPDRFRFGPENRPE